jgi:phosphatidylserine decarboxylase
MGQFGRVLLLGPFPGPFVVFGPAAVTFPVPCPTDSAEPVRKSLMKIDRAGVPFIAVAAGAAVGLVTARRYRWATSFALLGGFFAYFFRDPDRNVPQAPGLVVSPADGRVMFAGPAEAETGPPGAWLQIAIFLSPVDVHINRSPVAGRVTKIDYRPGRFLPAYDARAGENELNEIWVDADGTSVVFRQVVGILARRIVCRIHEGQEVQRGERIGLMKFGSRMDVFLPRSAELCVREGDYVVAGETVLAVLQTNDAA